MDKATVIHYSHELGMHEKVFHADCPACVDESYDSYLSDCLAILKEMGKADQEAAFTEHLRVNVYEHCGYWTFHEHPIYFIAGFLGVCKIGADLDDDPLCQEVFAAERLVRLAREALKN